MSAAFRNFILTLVVMLIVLGFAAWKLVPMLEDAILAPIFNETSEDDTSTTVPPDVSEPDNPGTDTSNSEIPTPADTVFDCLFVAKNDAGHACAVIYMYVSKLNNSCLICTLPVDMYLDNSGRYVPLYDLIGSQSTDYVVKKLSALIGHDVQNYAIINTDSLKQLAAVKSDITVELPYDVKFLNPDFAVIPEGQRREEHYISLSAGTVTLSQVNAAGIYNSQREEGEVNYSFQQSMALSVLKQVFSDTRFATDLVAQKKIHAIAETNMSYADFSENARLIFSYATVKQTMITYPTSKNYGAENTIVPDWVSGISSIESARG